VKKPKVLFVANTAWYLYNLRLGVIRHIQSLGYETVCVAPDDAFSEKLVAQGSRFIPVEIEARRTNPLHDAALLLNLYKIYTGENPTLIIHYTIKPNIYGTLAASLARAVSIAIVSGAGYAFSKKNWLNRVVKRLFKVAFSQIREVWFVNPDDRMMFIEEYLVAKHKTRELRGEGIDTEIFNPQRYAKPEPDGTFRFLFSGRLLREKGIGVYAEAARLVKKKYPETEFQVLGFLDRDNPNSVSPQELGEWVAQNRIVYLGKTDDVIPFICRADAVVLPSYYREGVPRALLEAASLATPIITTNHVGCRETVEDGVTGFLVEPQNPADLAAKLIRLIELPAADRQRMGNAGREKMIREFHERLILAEYTRLLDELHVQNTT
jgi:glycosyltransferase involved in cell wall biosynthesis